MARARAQRRISGDGGGTRPASATKNIRQIDFLWSKGMEDFLSSSSGDIQDLVLGPLSGVAVVHFRYDSNIGNQSKLGLI